MGEQNWDPFKTFNVSDAERDLIDRRRRTRDKFREEYRRLRSDPRNSTVTDLNFERWFSLRNNQVQLMCQHVTKHRVKKIFTRMYLPIGLTVYFIVKGMEAKSSKIDSGELSYGERVRSINCIGCTV